MKIKQKSLLQIAFHNLDIWLNQRNWILSIRKRSSTYRAFRNSQLRTNL